MFKIAVLSDTHDHVDAQLPALFAGADRILHAGDIGLPHVVRELEAIAPVTWVGGNCDDPGFHFRLVETVELAGHKFLLHHIVNPHAPSESLQRLLARERPAVVVFGHSHRPFCERLDGVLFFNPGYAGRSRFGMQRSVGILECDESGIQPRFLPLP